MAVKITRADPVEEPPVKKIEVTCDWYATDKLVVQDLTDSSCHIGVVQKKLSGKVDTAAIRLTKGDAIALMKALTPWANS